MKKTFIMLALFTLAILLVMQFARAELSVYNVTDRVGIKSDNTFTTTSRTNLYSRVLGADSGTGTPRYRGVAKWNISNLTGQTITQCLIQLEVQTKYGTSGSFNASNLSVSWNTANASTALAYSMTLGNQQISQSFSPVDGTFYNFTLPVGICQAWANGLYNNGLFLKNTIGEDLGGDTEYGATIPMFLFVNYTAGGGGGGGNTTVTFVAPTPVNAGRNSTNVILNMTSGSNYTTLWFGNTSNLSASHLVFYNQSTATNGSKYWVTNVTTDETYYYKASGDGGATNTSVYSWTYDTTKPVITINANSSFTAANVTKDIYSPTLNFSVTVTDNSLLYGLLVNVTRNGVVFYNMTNESLTGTSYTWNKNVNITTWASGTYTIDMYSSDSHTAQKIKDYTVIEGNGYLEFYTAEGNHIKVDSKESGFTKATKSDDRYTFDFNFTSKVKKGRTFTVTSDKVIRYYPTSSYAGHLVVWDAGKKSGNWIDFEGAGAIPTVTKVDDYTYTIYFASLDPDVKFKSIGGMNVNHQTYLFNNSNVVINSSTILPVSPLTILNISMYCQGTEDLGNNLNLSWIYWKNNVSNQTGTVETTSGTNVNVLNLTTSQFSGGDLLALSCSASGGSFSTSYLNSSYAYVSSFILDNCSSATNPALVINIFDENNLTPLTSDVVGTLTYSLFGETNDYTTDLTGVSNFTYCIYPNYNYTVNAYYQYIAGGGFSERYYINDLVVDNQTTHVYFYNFASDDGLISKLSAQTYTYYFSYYPNLTAQLLRFYPADNTWRTVQVDKTDTEGKLLFWVYQDTKDYKLAWYDGTSLVDLTSPIKFSNCDTSTLCTATFALNSGSTSYEWAGMNTSINYNNDTGIITASWYDANGAVDTVRLYVYKLSNGQKICDTNTSSTSGTLICNVSGYTGTIRADVYRSGSPFSTAATKLIEIAGQKIRDILSTQGYRNDGAFFTFLIISVCIGFGLAMGSLTATIILSVVGFFAAFFLGLVSVVTFALLTTVTVVAIIVIIILSRRA